MSTLCLCMIVKDDADHIVQCLDSVLRQTLLQYWIICDCGSTDSTRDIAEKFFEKRGIPGHFITGCLKDDAQMVVLLNQLRKEARDKADYTWFMEPQHSIEGTIQFPVPLTADVYALVRKYLVPDPSGKDRYLSGIYSDAVGWYNVEGRTQITCNKDSYTYATLGGAYRLYTPYTFWETHTA